MRQRLPLVVLAALAVVAVAAPDAPARAGVGYSAMIDYPGSIARGTVGVRAHVSGGVGDAEYAAYQVGTGGWVSMDKTGEGAFEALSSPWTTAALPNGVYRLEVRIWGDVPPYDPGDGNTFAKQAISVSVDNAPPTPGGLSVSPAASSARVAWKPSATSDRGDFAGYRVFRRAGASCAGTGGYTQVAETSATALTAPLAPGSHCFRVAAVRTSAVSGEIASSMSAPVKAVVGSARPGAEPVTGDPGFVTGTSGNRPRPPEPPRLGGGTLIVSDGTYEERLPYGSQTITQEVDTEAEGLGTTSLEAGADPRRTPMLVAAGLILAVGALLLRRFLAASPER